MKSGPIGFILCFVGCSFAPILAVAGGDGSSAEIRVTQTDSTLTLRAIVASPSGPLEGQYTMRVEKSGTSGRSLINQGGSFTISAAAKYPVVLSTSRISLAPDDQLKAELTVTLSDGTVFTDRYVEDQSD